MSAMNETTGRAVPRVAPPRMTRRQRLVLSVLLGSTFLLAADLSLLNVAIPLVGRDMRFSVGNLQWIATSFALASAGLALFFGRVGDFVGRRRMFIAGMALLVVSSLVGGLATTATVLIAARVAQGVATAMSAPAAMTLITTSFPEGRLRARALGANGAMVSAGFIAGAVLSGLLTGLLSWRWAFLVNVPVGGAIMAAAPLVLRESKVRERSGIDIPGAVTVSAGLAALVYGVSRGADLGWRSPVVFGSVAVAAVLLVVFWEIELHSKAPLASVWILRRPTVRWGNTGGLVTIAMQSGLIFLVTLYLQEVVGYSALATGLAFAVVGVAAFLGGVSAPRAIGRIGYRRSLVCGLALQMAGPGGLLLLSGRHAGIVAVLAVLAAGAFGHVTAVVSYMVTATSGLPDEEQGLATGLTTMTQQVALALGTPVLSAVATAHLRTVTANHAAGAAVLAGVRLALLVDLVVLLVAVLALAVLLGRRTAQPKQEE